MGSRGPVPNRSDQRRRRNEPEVPITTAPGADDAEQPAPDEAWHLIARRIYDSLAESGQSHYYEPSDWAAAYLMCESISRDLQPQFVGFTDSGEVITESIPLKGASLSAYRAVMATLLMTEGDRRRASLELQRGGQEADPDAERASATITHLRTLRGETA